MKDFRAVKTELACYAVIIFAAFLMGFAIKNLYDPVNLVTGGVSGVAIIFKSLFDIPLWLTNTLLNIPLFLAAWRLKGWNFIKRTFIATVSLSVSLYVLPEMRTSLYRCFAASIDFAAFSFNGEIISPRKGISSYLPSAPLQGARICLQPCFI